MVDQTRAAGITDRLRNAGVNVGAQVDNGVARAGSAGVDLAFNDKSDQGGTMTSARVSISALVGHVESVVTLDDEPNEGMKCQCLCPPSVCDCRPAKGNLWKCMSHCGMLVCMRCVALDDPVICHCCFNDNGPAARTSDTGSSSSNAPRAPTQVTNADGTWRRADGSDAAVDWHETCVDQNGRIFV